MKHLMTLMVLVVAVTAGAQTDLEALNFIRNSRRAGACALLAPGTMIDRFQYSLISDNSILEIRVKRDEDTPLVTSGGWYVIRIVLSEVTAIQSFDVSNTKSCKTINVLTNPYGIEVFHADNDGLVVLSKEFFDDNFNSSGWTVDAVKVKANYPLTEVNRIINALKFLAQERGAEIRNSSF